ncbi:DUF4331 domain-containing protein [Streptomyces sp. NBC_00887]|uniref:DUF4331 domain-containing protein n=1 Tax=Streptomyces sp. NBC_00887 TaxID=2975859 RepID=UPI00386DF96A|nr:DUF4331 domain-containing protein [Streptomyces sp. NBC_00887]WSY35793.1 DUF4331 domain-containing protein [Streptomyces sp. NBC_00887]
MTATTRSGRTWRGRGSIALVACGALAAGGLTAAGVGMLEPETATASSHREAPLISGQPQFDNTDVYAFVSPDHPDSTTLVANWLPFQEPAGGPNFYTFAGDARYDIHIDSDGDAQDDLLYRFTFKDHRKNENTFLYNTGPVESLTDPDLNFTQTYDLELLRLQHGKPVSRHPLAKGLPVAPSNVGKASMPDYQALRDQAVQKIAGGLKAFAGQADDPFFLDLRVFDLLYGGDLSEVGNDTLQGYNVNTIALQVPNSYIRESAEQPVVGIYATTERKNAYGDWTRVSRLGMPLVNEVVNPVKDKDRFNASSPENDGDFLKNVTEPELPKLIEGIYKIKAPAEPRDDLVSVFLTGVKDLNQPPAVKASEMLRLNTSIKPVAEPKRLGVLDGDNAGFPNGRRLTDDVLDIALQVVEGELVGSKNDLGDAVDANDKKFGTAFPYVALPTAGSDVRASEAATKANTTGLTGGMSSITASWDDDTVMLASAGTGAATVLLVGFGTAWLRSRRRTGQRSWLG